MKESEKVERGDLFSGFISQATAEFNMIWFSLLTKESDRAFYKGEKRSQNVSV